MAVTKEQINSFIEAVQEKVNAERKPSLPIVIGAMWGRKNIRITETCGRANASVFCFVDRATGNILKAAGWKAPAEGVRGNIANGAYDVTAYGAVYFR